MELILIRLRELRSLEGTQILFGKVFMESVQLID